METKNNTFVLNMVMTDYQSKAIIADAEKRIIELKKEMSIIEPELATAKQLYDEAKAKYDVYDIRIKQEEVLLENISRGKNGLSKHSPLRVERAESHNDMKNREIKKLKNEPKIRFEWVTYAYTILKQANRYMAVDDLWSTIETRYNIKEKLEEAGVDNIGYSKLKWGGLNTCIRGNVELTRNNRPRGVLSEFKGKIGLREWTSDGVNPQTEYFQKQFEIE